MSVRPNKVLLVEDNPGDIRLVRELLSESQHTLFNVTLECADSLSAAIERLVKDGIDLVLLDLSLPDSHGLSTFEKVHSLVPQMPIIVLSGLADEELSIEAVKNGAQDYLVKGQVDGSTLIRSIRYAIERQRIEWSLYESEDRYKNLVQLMPDIIYTIDPGGKFTFINEAVRTLGYGPEELLGKHFSIIIDPADIEAVSSTAVLPKHAGKKGPKEKAPKLFDERRTGERKTKGLEIRIRAKNVESEISGKMKWINNETVFIEVTSSGQYDKDVHKKGKKFLGTIGVIRDITDRQQAYDQIRKLSRAVEQSPSVVMIMDTRGIVEYVNPKFTQQTGYIPEEVIGEDPNILKSDTVPPGNYKQIWEDIISGKEWEGEFTNVKKNCELYWEFVQISPIRNSNGEITHVIKVSEDITERKKAEETIQRMAYYDNLTGLPNRTLFNDRLTQAIAHAQRKNEILAVLFLDLDRFKLINDTLGHAMGDKLLQSVSNKLKEYVRKDDTVSRSSGDEFTLLFTGITNTKDVEMMAQKIIKALRQPFVFGNHELNITTSLGIAIYPKDGKNGETLLKNADTAMYHAKERGRDNFECYNHSLHEKATKKLLLDTKLRLALEKDQFILHYQPQIEIHTEQIVGVEALLRWQHPDLGLVSPMDFISTAEGSGMIVPIGEWVLRTACMQIKSWQNLGIPPIRISVNLSAQSFIRQNLVEVINKTLKQTGVSPHLLEIEITESTIMKNIESTIYKLSKLKELGINISIDDFGTGYSSLSYLRKFPIHTLKIDGSFIRDILGNQDDAAIVTAIIAMAKKLRLKLVAEGVETKEQLAFLKQQKCDMAQGYLISRPLPTREIEKLLFREKALTGKKTMPQKPT